MDLTKKKKSQKTWRQIFLPEKQNGKETLKIWIESQEPVGQYKNGYMHVIWILTVEKRENEAKNCFWRNNGLIFPNLLKDINA